MCPFAGNFTIESETARSDFERRMMEKTHTAHNVLSQLPTWMWKCDTARDKQIENETYIQFTELLQVNNSRLSPPISCLSYHTPG